jgi:hypothetical protein
MNIKEKVKLLESRHIFITIEWGGTDMFSNCSYMSSGGVEELIKLLSREDDKKVINKCISEIIEKEND